MDYKINVDEYMKRFKVFSPSTLFDPDLSLLKESRCILCANKLKITRDGKRAYCSSIKHKQRFIVATSKLSPTK